MNWYPIILTAISALIGSLGQIEFKRGSQILEMEWISFLTNIHIIIGLCLYAFSTVLYLYALKSGQLSLIYPIIATSYIWVLIFARYCFDEPVSIINLGGVLFILIGITLISYR
jgi:uncharacterized membrane protein